MDGSYTIEGLQFINATSTATTTFLLEQGIGSGALTIAPVSTSGGIVVTANAGAVTISAPLVTSTSGGAATQTWSVDGTGASSLNVIGNVNFGAPVRKTGAGTLTLSGTNTGSGGLTIGAGTVRLGSVDSLGAGTLTVGALSVFDNSSGAALTLANNATNWNGAFTFTGTNDLSFGTGTATLSQSLTATVSAKVLSVGSLSDGSGSFGLTKAGNGTLTVSGAVTIEGVLALNAGALNIGTGGTMGDVTAASGTTLTMTGSNTLASLTGTAATISLSGTNTFNGAVTVNGGTLAASGNNAFSSVSLTAGALTLSGTNTYATGLSITGGTLNLNSAGALGGGTLAISGGTLNNSSASDKVLSGVGAGTIAGSFTFTGDKNLTIGTSSLVLSNTPTVNVAGGTLAIEGDVTGVAPLTKSGAGTLSLGKLKNDGGVTVTAGTLAMGAGSSYEGSTGITGSGILVVAGNNNLGPLSMGAASGTGGSKFDLSNGSAAINALLVQTNSGILNNIVIGSGQELNVGGSFTVGVNGTGSTTTRLVVAGLGTLSIGTPVQATNASFQLGNHSTDNFSNDAILTMSGLSTFYANLGAGTFRVGDPTNASGSATAGSKLYLAKTSTVIATTITTDGPNTNQTNYLYLGDTTNVFNATNVTVSGASRTTGQISWDTGITTGTFKLRGLNGDNATPVTNFSVGYGSTSTGAVLSGLVNLAGHNSDLLITTLGIGGNSAATTTAKSGTFTFDTGTLVATTVWLGARTGTTQVSGNITGTLNLMASGGTGSATFTTLNMGTNSSSAASTNGTSVATLTIGGGTVNVTGVMTLGNNSIGNSTPVAQTAAPVQATTNISGGAVTIGTLNMNVNSSANTGTGNTSLATLNISGGTVAVTTLSLANTSNAAATATSVLSLTGGTLTLGADLGYSKSAGTVNSTLTLNGGTLDLAGFAVGTSLLRVGSGTGALNLRSGTLKNVLEINGGAGFEKTAGSGTNTLVIDGTNDFSGVFTITSGTVQVGSGTVGVGSTTGTLGTVSVTNNAALRFNRSDAATFANVITGSGTLTQAGSGTLTLSAGNGYAGATSVNAGILSISHDTALGTVAAGTTVGLNASLELQGGITVGAEALGITGTGSASNGALRNLSGNNSFGGTVTLNADATIQSDAGTLTLDNATSIAAGTQALIFAAAGNITVSGAITGTSATLTKAGLGTLLLSGGNGYNGTTSVNAGILSISHNTALGTTSGGTTVGANASLELQGGITVGAEAIAITGTGSATNGALRNLSGANSFGGTVTLNADATIQSDSGTLTLGNATAITAGTRALTFGGAGNVTVTGGVTGTDTTLTKVGTGTLEISGTVNIGSAGTINVSAGTLTKGFTSSDVVGTVNVANAATLSLADGTAVTLASKVFNLANGSTLGLDIGALGINDSLVLDATSVLGASVTINLNALSSIALDDRGYTLLTASGGLDFTGTNWLVGALSGTSQPSGRTYQLESVFSGGTSSLYLTVSEEIFRYFKGATGATWNDANNWSQDSAGLTPAGSVPSAIDSLIFSASNTTGTSFVTTLDAALTVNSLNFTSTPTGVATFSIAPGLGGRLTISSGNPNNGITVQDNAGAVTISAPLTASSIQTWSVAGTGSALTITGDTTFTSRVNKSGAGVLTLNGAGTGAGGFSLDAGSVNIGNASAFGTGVLKFATGVTFNNSSGASLVNSGDNAQEWNSGFTFTGNHSYDLGVGAVTLKANAPLTVSGSTLTVGGDIDDASAGYTLTKLGSGELVLNGANSFGGAGKTVTITAGRLTFDSDAALGNAFNSLTNASSGATSATGFGVTGTFGTSRTINLNAAINSIDVLVGETLTLNSAFGFSSLANSLVKNGNGRLTLAADNNAIWTGGITFDNGIVRLGADSAAGSGVISVSPVTAAVGTALELAGNVTISNALSLQGTGNVFYGGVDFGGQLANVSGTNTYAGQITLDYDAAIGAVAATTLNLTGGINATANRQLSFNAAGNINLSSPLTSSGAATGFYAVNKYGTGTLTISTPQAFALSTSQYFSIREGTVVLNGGSKISSTTTTPTDPSGSTVITLGGSDTVATLGLQVGQYVVTSAFPSTIPLRTVITSVGTNSFTISSATTGVLGPLSFLSAGTMPVQVSLEVGATLHLDDSNVALTGTDHISANGRLGASALSDNNFRFRGGELIFSGSTDINFRDSVVEYIAKPEFRRGASIITLNKNYAGKMTLVFNNAPDNIAPIQSSSPQGSSVLFRGDDLFGVSNDPGRSNVVFAGGVTINGANGGIGVATKGILPWAVIGRSGLTAQPDGFSFATVDNAGGGGTSLSPDRIVRDLSPSEYESDFSVSVADKNLLFTSASATTTFATNVAPNSLTIEGDADLSLASGARLSLASGGILIRNGSDTTFDGGVLNQPSNLSPLNIWTIGSAQLTITSAMSGGNGVGNAAISTVKAGAGTLLIAPPTSQVKGLLGVGVNSLSGQFVLNQGTVKLGTGIKNAIQAGNQFALIAGTLDLNGNSQLLGSLFSDQNYATSTPSGTITSTSLASLIVSQDNNARDWAGAITGAVRFTKQGQNVLSLYSAQTYAQDTLVNGGTLTLTDEAALTGTTGLTVRFGSLTLDSANNAKNSNDRLRDATAITLAGGTFTLLGRAQTNTSETIGDVTVSGGASSFVVTAGGTGVNSAVLSAGSLVRQAGGTLYFNGPTGQAGDTSRLTFTSGVGLQNGIIGGWAVTSTGDFATYVPGLGVAGLGAGGYASSLSNSSSSAQNVKVSANSGISTNVEINSLVLNTSGTLTIGTGNKLTVGSGGIISNASWTIGSAVGTGTITSGGDELFLYASAGTLTVRSVIADGATSVGLVKFGTGTVALSAVNTYTGGTTINQGTLTVNAGSFIPASFVPSKGLVLNNSTFTQTFADAVASANVVTLNGGSTISYFGTNTQEGLVFRNLGGSSAPTVRSFVTTNAASMAGKLNIGDAGIVVTSANFGLTSLIEGRVDFGATMKTIDVGAIDINGSSDVAPLQASLALQAVVGTIGGISKTGAGVLQFNAQSGFSGQVDVVGGGIKTGYTNAGSRFANLNLRDDTRFDLNGYSTSWGSLSGSGDVFSSSGTPTLTVGFDGTSTLFSGRLIRFNDAAYGLLTKVGVGEMTFTAAQDTEGSFGAITVSGGALKYSGAGKAFVSSAAKSTVFNVQSGGTLALDNVGTNVANRLGTDVDGTVNILGGTLALSGNSGANSSETIANLGLATGAGRIEFTPDAVRQLTLSITNLAAPSAGSLVIAGLAGTAQLVVTNANLVAGQGSLATALAVRGDILVSASVSGLGDGFLVNDAGTWRALASGDINSAAATWESQQNAGLSSAESIGVSTSVNTLTLDGITTSLSTSLPAGFGRYGVDGTDVTLTLANASAVLVKSGTADINVGLRGSSAQAPQFHVLTGAILNLNSAFGLGSSVGFVKSGGGTLNLNAKAGFNGVVTVNDGFLNLDSGFDHTIAVGESVNAARVSDLQLNGLAAVVDLLGHSQAVGSLSSVNSTAGMGGKIKNSLLTLATLTSTGGGAFGGAISGNLNFVRSGNNTTTLTDVSDYVGDTVIRGGTLRLVDSGSLSATSAVKVNYGALVWDNFGQNPDDVSVPARFAQTVPVSLLGGTVRVIGAGSVNTDVTFNQVSLLGGANVLDTQPIIGSAATVRVNIGNLLRTPGSQTSMLFSGRSTLNSAGTNTLGQISLSGSSLVMLSNLNGSAYSASSMVNGIIGGWAVASGDTYAFATYSNTTGVGQMATFSSGLISDTTGASGNYSNNATNRTITGSAEANSWRLSGAAHVVTFASGASLTLGAGLVTSGNVTYTLGASDATNTITGASALNGGDGNLYLFASQNTTSIQPKITGTSAVVSFGSGTLQLAPQFADNNYSGGTFVNAGTLNLSSRGKVSLGSAIILNSSNTITMPDTTGFTVGMVIYNANFPGGTKVVTVNPNVSLVVDAVSTNSIAVGGQTISSRDSWAALPAGGSLTIGNATVALSNTQAGQVGAGTSVTINGGGRLVFGNYASRAGADLTQSLTSVTFVNEGGTVNPEFNLGTPTGTGFVSRFILTDANAITATNESLSTVPTIRTGSSALTSLEFSNASPTITVIAGAGVIGLNISAPIGQNVSMTGPLQKAGLGTLALTSSDSTFTTGVNLDAGSLMIGASSDGLSLTKGPLGTGTLTIAAGTSLFADNAARTLHNAVEVTGDFTIAGSGNAALTLAGSIHLGSFADKITFATAGLTTTFNGVLTTDITSGTGLTKSGNGILQLGSSSMLNLGNAGLTVEAGVIKAGTTDNLSANSLLTVNSGAGYDLNGNSQTSNAIAGDGFITNSFNGTSTLTLNVSAGKQTFNGLLVDNHSAANPLSYLVLDKQGADILELTNRNTYAGGTTVSAGTLLITGDGAIGPGDVNVVGGATLEYKVDGTSTSTKTYELDNSFAGSGDLKFNGDYALAKIVGDSVEAGGLNVSVLKGTLQIGNGDTAGWLDALTSMTISSGATLRFDRSDNVEFISNIFSDPLTPNDGLIIKSGVGTTKLSGDNSGFWGDVHVEAGILDAAASQTLEKVREIIISSGAELQLSQDYVTGFTGLGPDVTIKGTGILRLLASTSGLETFGIVNDLTLEGGTVASGIGSSGSVNSLLLTGSLKVDDDATISARNVGLVRIDPQAYIGSVTDINVATNKTLTFSGTISDPDQSAYSSVSSFNKKGAGTMILSGDNSAMSGSVTVSAGTLVVNHENALGTGIVTVSTEGRIFSNQTDFTTRAAIANNIIVDTGATLGVGPTIGTFSSTSLTLSGGSKIEFKMRDSSLAAGTGYDKFDFGAINLSGVTNSTPIIIVLKSLDLSGALGEAFNVTKPGAAYVFNFGTFDKDNSNLGTGNISDLFSFDTTAFTYTGGGSNDAGLWSINFNTANGAITLTAVPEPSTYGFGLGALALAAAAIRRRKRQVKKA